ncbi:MAG: hypothetical protein AB7P00_16560, partial [Sandaracinaceae bacterium]
AELDGHRAQRQSVRLQRDREVVLRLSPTPPAHASAGRRGDQAASHAGRHAREGGREGGRRGRRGSAGFVSESPY